VTSATRDRTFPMPPKEKAANAGVTAESQQSAASDGIYNYELPRSLVAKIARASVRDSDRQRVLGDKHAQVPDNCKFQKETILALLKGSTVFINCLGAYTFVRSQKTLSTQRSPQPPGTSRSCDRFHAFSEPNSALMK